MRIPLPRVPEWWSATLDEMNEPLFPGRSRGQVWRVRRIDPFIAAIYAAVIVLDGMYVQGWPRAA